MALCVILEDCQHSSDYHYSPTILTDTRFRRPPRLPRQPFRLALKDPDPGAIVQASVGHRDHHGCAWRPIARNTASCVSLQVRVGQACLRQAPVPSCRTGVLSSAVVQPARGPALLLMDTLAVICGSTLHCKAFARVSTFLAVCRTHTPAGSPHRGPGAPAYPLWSGDSSGIPSGAVAR